MNSANTRGSRPRPRGPDPKRRDPGDGPGREENAMNRETRTPNEPHGGKSLPAGLKPIIIFGVVLAVLAILGLATESKIIIPGFCAERIKSIEKPSGNRHRIGRD